MKNGLLIRTALVLMVLGLLFTACRALPEESLLAAPTGTPAPTATPFQPATATSTVTPTPAPSATPTATPLPACTENQGKVEQLQFDSQALKEPLVFRVYTPPCFGQPTTLGGGSGYPVLYMLHGQLSTDEQWVSLGLTDAADRLIASQELPPFLVVMPYEKGNLKHPFTTGFEQAIPDELVPWIDAHYKTCTDRACRAIGGLSRGASWAVRFGFTRWELFGTIGAHSVPPFIGDPGQLPGWLAKIPGDQRPRIWIDIGEADPYLAPAEELETLLTKLNVAHEWHLNPGTHDADYWSSHVEEYLRWYCGVQ